MSLVFLAYIIYLLAVKNLLLLLDFKTCMGSFINYIYKFGNYIYKFGAFLISAPTLDTDALGDKFGKIYLVALTFLLLVSLYVWTPCNNLDTTIDITYAEILPIYQLNSGKFLRHGPLYYTWGQHILKILPKLNEGFWN